MDVIGALSAHDVDLRYFAFGVHRGTDGVVGVCWQSHRLGDGGKARSDSVLGPVVGNLPVLALPQNVCHCNGSRLVRLGKLAPCLGTCSALVHGHAFGGHGGEGMRLGDGGRKSLRTLVREMRLRTTGTVYIPSRGEMGNNACLRGYLGALALRTLGGRGHDATLAC